MAKSSAVEIIPLTAEHLAELGEPELSCFLSDFSFAALYEGRAIAAGGVSEIYWPGRGHAWFTKGNSLMDWRMWPPITRAVKSAVQSSLATGRFRRVEMTVYDSDEGAKSWARQLGFYPEAKCKKLMQDGSDGWIYARVE